MKRRISLTVCLAAIVALCCGCAFGTKYVTDIAQYGKIEHADAFPSFFPKTVDDLTVNDYRYTLYSFMDTCYEIFLDVTVTEAQLEQLIASAKTCGMAYAEQEAYYAEGYREIVFTNAYRLDSTDGSENVGNAKIDKVVYHPQTGHIVFESFDAFDSGVYPLDEVAYFVRFDIDQEEYARYADTY